MLDRNEPQGDGTDIYLLDILRHPSVRLRNTLCGKSNAGVCAND